MSLATTIDPHHYAMLPMEVILNPNLSATSLRIVAILLGFCSRERNEAWGDTRKLAAMLKCTERNIQLCYNELIKEGLISDTGTWSGCWRVFKILCHPFHKLKDKVQEITSRPKQDFANSEAPLRTYQSNEQNNLKNNNNAEKIENEVHKEKTKEVVVTLDNKTVEKLRDKGIAKEQAHKLVATHGDDACMKQVEHLEALLQQDKPIKNPIAWLVTAIKQRFAQPEPVKVEQAPQMSDFEKKHRELLRKAKEEMYFKDYPRAIAYANEALAFGERDVFRRIIADASKHLAVAL